MIKYSGCKCYKVYVGQSNNLARRKQEHLSKLSNRTHHNQQMLQFN